MSRSKAVAALVVLVLLASTSCWRRGRDRAAAFDEETIVIVENHNWLEMVVYASRSGSRLRLGSVATGKSEEFQLPSGFTAGSSITLIADPIGSTISYRTEPLIVAPGRLVQLRVENDIRQSSVRVR